MHHPAPQRRCLRPALRRVYRPRRPCRAGAARKEVFSEANWQRRHFHLARNAFSRASTGRTARIGAELRDVWNAVDADRAQAALNELVDSYRDTHPDFAEWFQSSVSEGFTIFALPDRHRI